jgi:RNA polymerase sigma factor (sigma-70 family)
MDSTIANIRAEGKEALADLYKSHRSAFLNWVTKFGCTRDEAKDAYQAAVLALYENIVSGKLTVLNSGVKTYLFAIGRNKILEMKRATGKLLGTEGLENSLPDVPEEEGLGDPQQLKRVALCLEKLGEPCATLLKEFYYHCRSLEEIARQLDYKTTDSAKNQKYKCLARLRKLFNEEKIAFR